MSLFSCWSSVGQKYWTHGGQSLSLGSGCNITATVMHELLHALGFWHEQSRPDRNKYVEILWENIEAGVNRFFGLSVFQFCVVRYDV